MTDLSDLEQRIERLETMHTTLEQGVQLEYGSVFERWKEYERMTIHFNDLILKVRTKALAGVAAVGTIGGFILESSSRDADAWVIVSVVSIVVFIMWVVLWRVDHCYYTRMLLGAVSSLLVLEAGSNKKLDLSLRVEATVNKKSLEEVRSGALNRNERQSSERGLSGWRGPFSFYAPMATVLLLILAFAVSKALGYSILGG